MNLPETAQDLAELLRRQSLHYRTILLEGNGTKRQMAGPAEDADESISTSSLNRVLDYQPRDLTISVEAGLPLVPTLTAKDNIVHFSFGKMATGAKQCEDGRSGCDTRTRRSRRPLGQRLRSEIALGTTLARSRVRTDFEYVDSCKPPKRLVALLLRAFMLRIELLDHLLGQIRTRLSV